MSTDEILTLAQREAAMSADELAETLAAVRRDRDALDDIIDRMQPLVTAALGWYEGRSPRFLSEAVEAYRARTPQGEALVVDTNRSAQ